MIVSRLWRRLRALVRKGEMEHELGEELNYHLERQIELNLASGMNQEQARREAMRAFDGMEQAKEKCRDARGVRVIEDLLQDLRYGLRRLLKKPGFTVVAALTLALGIGANSAIFSVVNAVLLRPLPYPDAERLMTIWEDHRGLGGPEREWTSPTGFEDWRDQAQSFEQVAALQGWQPTLTGRDEPEQLVGARVSHNIFSLLGVLPAQGRSFNPEEDKRGAAPVVVISHGLWQRRFGADPGLVGRTISLMGESYTVIGVMPQNFKFPVLGNTEIWRTIQPVLSEGCKRGCITIRVIGRLKPGVTEAQARAELVTIARRIEQQFPETNSKVSVTLTPLHEFLVGNVRTPLLVLLCAVSFVLLIACANVANLLLARAATRNREMAIRSALGAGRARIIRQLLTESLLLAALGGALGLLLAYILLDLLVSLSPTGTLPADQIVIDGRVLGFTLVVSFLTGLFFGLVPALQTSKTDLNLSLKESGKGTQAAPSGRRVLGALVVLETALALVLLVGAGLLIRSFVQLRRVDSGFNPANVLTATVSLPATGYPERQQITAFYEQLVERISALPDVESAGAVSSLPLGGFNSDSSFIIEGAPAPPPEQRPVAWYSSVTPQYFSTMGINLRSGRAFTERDDEKATRVVIVSEAMARRYWPNESPIGKRIGSGRTGEWFEIVGILSDVKQFGLSQDARPTMYFPLRQQPARRMTLVLRAREDAPGLAPALRRLVASSDPNLAVSNLKTMERITAESIGTERFTLLLLGTFAGLALMLAAIGIYGVMAYSVAQRTQEIGVRIALGARVGDIFRLVIGRGVKLVLIGVGVGLAASFALTRLMASLLYGVSANDPATFAGIALLLVCVALLACYLPARRATKVDPMIALRYE